MQYAARHLFISLNNMVSVEYYQLLGCNCLVNYPQGSLILFSFGLLTYVARRRLLIMKTLYVICIMGSVFLVTVTAVVMVRLYFITNKGPDIYTTDTSHAQSSQSSSGTTVLHVLYLYC